ncbi:mRNA 3'-end-processing protein rna14 [Xylographa carneopallida]|nr:mRNA 3'-end-processing protein rna14 [Xylographa carneopallida]
MADAEAEAAFLSSMQVMNEGTTKYEDANGASAQQIDSSSSDEYDPASDVQDMTMSPGPQSQFQPDPISSLDSSSNATSHPVSATTQQSSAQTNGDTTVTSLSEVIMPNNNKSDTTVEATVQQSISADSPITALPDTNSSLDTSATVTNNGPTTHNDSVPARKEISKNDTITETSSTSAPSKARLPHDKIGLLEDRIKEDERGDMDAWLSLIGEYRKRGKIEEARKVYERYFTVFPSAAEQWVAYTQLENEAQNRHGVEAIFGKILQDCPNLQLWTAYLDHVRRYFSIASDKVGNAGQINHQAYEAVIAAVGIDKDAGKLWQDYVQFIKTSPGVLGGNNWQDQQKMDLLRKTYQSAVCIPTQAVEGLWRDYNSFEMGLNKLTGRKFLQDQSPAYMTARSSYMELQNITRDLKRTTLPALPPAFGFEGDVEYMKQVDIWKRWIQWEKDDPLVLKQDEPEKYSTRIVFVYKQALMALQYWPEMWFDAAEFCFNNDLETQGNDFLTRGISANPESCLLAFKRADRLELSTTNGNDDESKKRRGDTVREPYDKVLDALYELISKAMAREARDLARIEAHFSEASNALSNEASQDNNEQENDEAEEQKKVLDRQKNAQFEIVKAMGAVQIRLLHKTISHAWIALMRAFHRIQGKGKVGALVGGSRQIFTDSRKKGRITSDVWIAAAMLEFHSFEAESAKRIFERGVKLFPEDDNFALEYVKHLIATNDHTNARVVFETAVGRLTQKPETVPKAKPLYAYFHDFQSRYGELAQIIKLEKRISETFPDDPRLASFSERFAHEGFDPTAIRPIISPATQTRPKAMLIPSIEPVPSAPNSPPNRFIQITNSPKRLLPIEESDNESSRPRKLARGESPLKGAAGRRLDQQKRNRQPQEMSQYEGQPNAHMMPPPPLPRDVLFLLSIIPKSSTYHATKFNPEEMVRLIRETNIPNSVSQLRPPPPPQNGGGMQQMTPMPLPGQYNSGRYPRISQPFYHVSSPQHSSRHRCKKRNKDVARIRRRCKRQRSRAREYKDSDILGLSHSHDSVPQWFSPPFPRALHKINLLATISPDDLNAVPDAQNIPFTLN